jgi:circadian clock protein KaiB
VEGTKIKGEQPKPEDSFAEFEKASKERGKEQYVLRLFISGMTTRSINAIESLKKICEEQLKDCYSLEIIDVSQQPNAVRKEDVVATPTLIKELPKPIRRIIGDLSNRDRILVALNLKENK